MIYDPSVLVDTRMHDLLDEADQERLAAQLPRTHAGVRHGLASVCVRLAHWIDEHDPQDGYAPRSDSGPSEWVEGSAPV